MKSLKMLPLQTYEHGKNHCVGYALATNTANDDPAHLNFLADRTLKRTPTVQVFSTKAFDTVQENINSGAVEQLPVQVPAIPSLV